MATTLTRSTSGDTLCRSGRPCRRSGELRRSDSFLRELRPWVPKCPTGVDSEWQLLGGLPRSKLPRADLPTPRWGPYVPHSSAKQPFQPSLVLRRGSSAPPCSLLPVRRRHGRAPGTRVSRAMRRGPSSRRALLSRRVECARVHAHAPAQGRRLQRDVALLGARVRLVGVRVRVRVRARARVSNVTLLCWAPGCASPVATS